MIYDAFLSYNSKNIDGVSLIKEYLTNSHLKVFWDKDLIAGTNHQEAIEKALSETHSICVFIGEQGLGPWQKEEYYNSYWDLVQNAQITMIPVLLPGATIDSLPIKLRTLTAVCFSKNIDEATPLQDLVTGILGNKPLGLSGMMERPLDGQEFNRLVNSTVNQYNSIAEQFYEEWKNNLPQTPIHFFIEQLGKCADPLGKVLDAGCGPGHHSHYLHSQKISTVGIDLAQKALDIAKISGNGPEFFNMDMRNLRFKSNYFSGIWASASCVHVLREFFPLQLNEFFRALKPKGVLGITLQISRVAAVEKDGRFFESYRDKEEICSQLEYSGFEILDTTVEDTTRNTYKIKKVQKWCGVIAKVPDIKPKIAFEKNT